jgi:hypothetical protein
MPRHARHGHATPHQQKFEKEKERKNRSKGRARNPFIHFTHTWSASQFSSKGKVYNDVTSASLAF